MTDAELLAPFDSRVEPVEVTTPYRVLLVLVALVMVALPVLYVSMVGAVGWLTWLHAATNSGVAGGSVIGFLVLYLGPIVVGLVAVVFLIKPLFAPRPKPPPPWTVDAAGEARLVAFVARLSASIGAPRPTRIDLDVQANASASFRRGFRSFFAQDLVLTIGLPLIDGMTTRQIAGILAHEFGHFAQGAGMRLSYVIRSVSVWFARVVYERDAWDEALDRHAEQSESWLVTLVLQCARICVWVSRRVLWLLMVIGNLVSTALLRQMEFDADRYEARVAGSDAFAGTSARLTLLSVARQAADNDVQGGWTDRRLPDDLPRLVSLNAQRLATLPDVADAIAEHERQAEASVFDTHPPNRQRIESAAALGAPGIYLVDAPARTLFADFETTCRDVTDHYYQQLLGDELATAHSVSSQALADELTALNEQSDALARYLQGCVTAEVYPDLSGITSATNTDDARAAIEVGREALMASSDAFEAALGRLNEAEQRRQNIAMALTIRGGGYPIDLAFFDLDDPAPSAIERDLARAAEAVDVLLETGMQLMAPVHRRMRAALSTADPAAFETQTRLMGALARAWRHTDDVADACSALMTCFQLLNDDDATEQIGTVADEAARRARTASQAALQELEHVAYPYEHPQAPLSVGTWARETQLSDMDERVAAHQLGTTLLERLNKLRFRMLVELVALAEEAETALGFDPLPLHHEEDEEDG